MKTREPGAHRAPLWRARPATSRPPWAVWRLHGLLGASFHTFTLKGASSARRRLLHYEYRKAARSPLPLKSSLYRTGHCLQALASAVARHRAPNPCSLSLSVELGCCSYSTSVISRSSLSSSSSGPGPSNTYCYFTPIGCNGPKPPPKPTFDRPLPFRLFSEGRKCVSFRFSFFFLSIRSFWAGTKNLKKRSARASSPFLFECRSLGSHRGASAALGRNNTRLV